MSRASVSIRTAVVLGGGIAGCAAALALCRHGIDDVLIIEAGGYDAFQIGESIPPESRLLLERLGIWNAFQQEGHEPCLGSRSAWGSDTVGYNDFLLNPHGTGWHLDRRRFGAFLAQEAGRAGAEVRSGTRFVAVARGAGGSFELALKTRDGLRHVRARFVVDATGPQSRFARAVGAKPHPHDRLVWIGAVLRRPAASDFSRLTMVEAVATGWWYAAAVPRDRVVVAAITDAQTNAAAMLHRGGNWLADLRATRHMAQWLADCGCEDAQPTTIRTAPSFVLDRVFGSNWIAVGDAASAYDPIASQGIYKALSEGLRAAEAIAAHLAGARDAFDAYQAAIAARFSDYLTIRNHFYDLERRWPEATFWSNRTRRPRAAQAGATGRVQATGDDPRPVAGMS